MINSLAKEVPDRWKFVDDLTIVESCFRNLISDPLSILNEIGSEALDLYMTVNPSLFNHNILIEKQERNKNFFYLITHKNVRKKNSCFFLVSQLKYCG